MKEEKIEKIEKLNQDKVVERANLQTALDAMNSERAELLVAFATGEEGSSAKLATLQKKRLEILTQIEAIDALLASIPAQKAKARAEAIEADLYELDQLMSELRECAPEIDDASEKFVLALKRQADVVNKLRSLNKWAFQDFYVGASVASIPYFLEKHGLQQVDRHLGNQSFVESLEKSHLVRNINTLKHHMQQSIKGLKGEEVDNRNGYCSRCYGAGQRLAPGSSKTICAKCGNVIRE